MFLCLVFGEEQVLLRFKSCVLGAEGLGVSGV